MARHIFIDSNQITLPASQLIQSGGEGLVFSLGRKAVKLYHQPQKLHQDKLIDWERHGYRTLLPSHVLGPEKLALDEHGCVIGYLMARLPEDSKPLKQLSTLNAWKAQKLLKRDVVSIFLAAHAALTHLHQIGLIVGDLNDQNIYSPLPAGRGRANQLGIQWIDVDSFQFGGHPCPVAMEAFLDPSLYSVKDFSLQPCFSRDSDWYAFQVMLLKTLLLVHPYGGSHHQQKSLRARASAQTSIFSGSVTYPQLAHPIESLTDEILHHFFQVFEEGRRLPFPARLLHNYQSALTACAHCGFQYPASRKSCPNCKRQSQIVRRPKAIHGSAARTLLDSEGTIEAVHVGSGGKISAIIRSGDRYTLFRMDTAGSQHQVGLFDGGDDYRFALFGDNLVVNSVSGSQLLLLDTSKQALKQLALIETASFKGSAVFATSANYLYRIAGSWLMRGSVRDGKLVEDPISTVHKQQTQLFASAHSDMIGGFHRVFAEYQFFMISPDGVCTELAVPPLLLGESEKETVISFGHRSAAVLRVVIKEGRSRLDINEFNLKGQPLRSCSINLESEGMIGQLLESYPYTTQPGLPAPPFVSVPLAAELAGSRIVSHPQGLVLQNSRRLSFIPLTKQVS